MSVEYLRSHLRTIQNFPVQGICFWDVTTLFQNATCLKEIEDILYDTYRGCGITKVVGLESRGFVMGAALAVRLGAGFVPARKPGKLPGDKVTESYSKEYGRDAIEIHTGFIGPDDVVLIHDDLLATGGTMAAAVRLVGRFHPAKTYINVIIEIESLGGRATLPEGLEVSSIIKV